MKLQLMEVKSSEWNKSIPAIQLALNMEKLQALGASPFQILHGLVIKPTNFVDEKEISD